MTKRGFKPADQAEMKKEVVDHIKHCIHKYGAEAGAKLAREKYPDDVIRRSTWYRWLKELNASPMDVAVSKAIKAADQLPAAPSPSYIAERPVEARKNIDLLSRLEALYADAEMLRAYSVTEKDGKEVIRIPTFFSQSIKLRSDLLENALRALGQVWDLQRMQGLYDLIIEAIGEADPETQRKVLERLRELNEKTGISMEVRM